MGCDDYEWSDSSVRWIKENMAREPGQDRSKITPGKGGKHKVEPDPHKESTKPVPDPDKHPKKPKQN